MRHLGGESKPQMKIAFLFYNKSKYFEIKSKTEDK